MDITSEPKTNSNPPSPSSKEIDGIPHQFNISLNAWFPTISPETLDTQSSVYLVPGVDITAPAPKRADIQKKRKAAQEEMHEGDGSKDTKRRNTAVYVTGLPLDADVLEVGEYFKKCGIILDDGEGGLRVKMYTDGEGRVKGDALVVYFKEESVEMACNLLDDTLFRPDAPPIRVNRAVFKEKESTTPNATTPGDNPSKEKIRRKIQKLKNAKLDWDESTDPSTTDTPKSSKTVILKHMFSIKDLDEDPTLLLDLKEDVRDECGKLGEITNVVLYDLEEDGVISVKFRKKESAVACIGVMNGRWFAKRKVSASLWDGKEKWRRSRGAEGNDEAERLESFSSWIESN